MQYRKSLYYYFMCSLVTLLSVINYWTVGVWLVCNMIRERDHILCPTTYQGVVHFIYISKLNEMGFPSWIDHFEKEWINLKLKDNHEITNQKKIRKKNFHRQDLNHGPLEPKASLQSCWIFNFFQCFSCRWFRFWRVDWLHDKYMKRFQDLTTVRVR